ncbi:MAG: hypothetical protein JWN31_1698 [Frankiales bacterium]|nr:hypothetical protein [Frankiales bacterium]
MSGTVTRPPLGTLLVVGALLAGSAVGGVATGTSTPGVSPSAEVVGATAVCPDLRQKHKVLGTRVSVGAAPLPEGRSGTSGAVSAFRIRSRTSTPVTVTAPGQVAVGMGASTTEDGLLVTATGELAAGLEVEQITRGESTRNRGLAGVRCESPRRESWFVGGATGILDSTTLVLANVDDTPSTVDVTVFTANGPIDSRLGQGITVQPHSRTLLNLDELAPDRTMLTLRVLSRRGRVAANVLHARINGRTPLGVDYVPRTSPPATSVVVPGFPKGPGTRMLWVTNPGVDDTTVSVRVTTEDGQFVPTTLSALNVPAGTTIAAHIDPITDTSALSALVTSDGAPILAGGQITDFQDKTVREIAYTGGTPPLSGPALLTDLVIDRPTESTLILSAMDAQARVLVTPIRVVGTEGALPQPKTVVVPAGRTRSLRLSTFYPPGTETQLAVEVRTLSGSGPVFAARYLREHGSDGGPFSTLLDLQGPAQRVPRPLVFRDPRLGF